MVPLFLSNKRKTSLNSADMQHPPYPNVGITRKCGKGLTVNGTSESVC